MALVKEISLIEKERAAVHKGTECTASIFEIDGERYLQLDTFGSADRQDKGKLSQSIQLTRSAARTLKELLGRAFPEL